MCDSSTPRIIAHRALLSGPNGLLENTPNQINKVLTTTPYDVEIDVWLDEQTNRFYLGHDCASIPVPEPQYQYLANPRFWIHAKNNAALFKLLQHLPHHIHIFTHDQDPATITSTRIPWIYPGQSMGPGAVIVMPERMPSAYTDKHYAESYAICTDYPAIYEAKMRKKTQ